MGLSMLKLAGPRASLVPRFALGWLVAGLWPVRVCVRVRDFAGTASNHELSIVVT